MSSVGNLSLTVAISHTSAPAGLGRFALAFALYAFVTGIVRASITDLDLSRTSAGASPFAAAPPTSLAGLVIACPVIALGLGFGSSYIWLTGVALHGILLYDYTKVVHLALVHPRVALGQECVWTAVTVGVSALCVAGVISPVVAYGIWAGTCALLGYRHVIAGRLSAVPSWAAVKAHNTLLALYAFEQLVSGGAAQLSTYIVAGVGGLETVGVLRAGSTLYGPLGILSATARSLAIPELVRAGQDEKGREHSTALRATLVQGVIAVLFVGAVAVLPDAVLRLAVGDNAHLIRALLIPLGIESGLVLVSTIALAGHRAKRAGRRSVVLFVALFPIRLIVITLAATYTDARGVAWVMAGMAVLATIAFWVSYLSLIAAAVPDRDVDELTVKAAIAGDESDAGPY